MKKIGRYWKLIVLLILIPVAIGGWVRWSWWNDFERMVVWDSWTVDLPKGGNLTYRTQSPRVRLGGPGEVMALLIWQRSDSGAQEYLLNFDGGNYHDLEFRMRQEGNGIWLISHDRKIIVATVDLDSGRVTTRGGLVYDRDGEFNDRAQPSTPAWANFESGRSLGRKKF